MSDDQELSAPLERVEEETNPDWRRLKAEVEAKTGVWRSQRLARDLRYGVRKW